MTMKSHFQIRNRTINQSQFQKPVRILIVKFSVNSFFGGGIECKKTVSGQTNLMASDQTHWSAHLLKVAFVRIIF